MTLSRREFVQLAAAMGASLAWGGGPARASRTNWRESRELYPEGVASGDPDPNSVILWTRRPFEDGPRHVLTVEVAEDEGFRRVIAQAPAPVSASSDWTTRVLVGRLKPAHVYWYRFTNSEGNGSRIGRTITAPASNDSRPVNFAFVSCQSVNEGKLNAYRRMIFEDERAPPAEWLGFVLHLGDFIYEVVEYPDEVKSRYDRIVYDVGRIPDGGKVGNFHYPLTLEGYRVVYKGYLADPDLQDARARWPFVCMWDNHEFSWQGWQSIQQAGGPPRPGQSIKVAANQAWFEFSPRALLRRAARSTSSDLRRSRTSRSRSGTRTGSAIEPNNLIAINSLKGYRALRYGRHLDLIITDQHSYRSADPFSDDSLGKLGDWAEFNDMFPESYSRFSTAAVPSTAAIRPRKSVSVTSASRTRRRTRRRRPSSERTKRPGSRISSASTATWKIWGCSLGALDWRADPQNLPAGLTKEPWPAGRSPISAAAIMAAPGSNAAEIYNLVRDEKIGGFAIVSGDRHSFWAGYAAAQLPPAKFEPVGLSFVGASLSSPGAMEAYEHRPPEDCLCGSYIWSTGRAHRSPTGPSTCCSNTAYAHASNIRRAST